LTEAKAAFIFPIGNKSSTFVNTPIPTTVELATAKDLGAAIRNARESMGLHQAAAALLCGVGVRYLSELENGKETIRLGLALKVIAGLGLALTISRKKPFWSKDGRRT